MKVSAGLWAGEDTGFVSKIILVAASLRGKTSLCPHMLRSRVKLAPAGLLYSF